MINSNLYSMYIRPNVDLNEVRLRLLQGVDPCFVCKVKINLDQTLDPP